METEADSEDLTPTVSQRRPLRSWPAVAVGAVLLSFVLRALVVQTFWIPSESMSPTLTTGDRIVVDKLAYRLGDPRRGDIVVFEHPAAMPAGGPAFLVKRIVALGGETVAIYDGVVHVGGDALDEPYIHGTTTTATVPCPITAPTPGIASDGFQVPEGTVLVMGDNRTDSTDGRCFGPINVGSIVGHARVIVWPVGRLGGL